MLLGLRPPNHLQDGARQAPPEVKPRQSTDEAYRAQTQELDAALKAEGYAFKVAPGALPERAAGGDAQWRPDEGAGTRDSFALAQRFGPVSLVA